MISRPSVLALAIALMVPGPSTTAEEPAPRTETERQARLDEMGKVAKTLRATRLDGGVPTPIPLRTDPLFRWSDATREIRDGGIWAWGERGRPAAVVAIEFNPSPEGGLGWSLEFVSLSTGPLRIDGGPGFHFETGADIPPQPDTPFLWAPRSAGVEFTEIAGAPAPTGDELGRLRQMKELLKRFTSREETAVRINLRPLPRPMHRYADPALGLVDGAIFVFANGTNPEALLLIEAQVHGPGRVAWQFAAVPLTTASVTVALDQKDVWTKPHPVRTLPDEPYFTALKSRGPTAPTEPPMPER